MTIREEIQGFIDFFEAIPAEKWTILQMKDSVG